MSFGADDALQARYEAEWREAQWAIQAKHAARIGQAEENARWRCALGYRNASLAAQVGASQFAADVLNQFRPPVKKRPELTPNQLAWCRENLPAFNQKVPT